MAERPKLPLKVQAEIESARERVLSSRLSFDMLFPLMETSPLFSPLVRSSFFPIQPRPATLKLQLSQYSSALFNAEVQYYPGYARDGTEMKSWLKETALRIASEVLSDIQPCAAYHDLHCTASERKQSLIDTLGQGIDYWVDRGPLEVPAEIGAGPAPKELLGLEHLAPTSSITDPRPPAPSVEPKPRRRHDAQFPNRATWLRERLAERGWDHNDLPRHGGPDRKTAFKILAGGEVRPDVLDKLAKALSFIKKFPVNILDIPKT